MAIELVQLSNAHGNRYTEADREAAYQLWTTIAGRSQRRTAEATGVPVSTVGSWSQREGWVERARREDADEAQSVRLSISAVVTAQAIASIQTAVAIRDDHTASHKDRLNASIWLAGIAGIVPIQKSDLQLRTDREQRVGDRTAYADKSTEQLAAMLNARLQLDPVVDSS